MAPTVPVVYCGQELKRCSKKGPTPMMGKTRKFSKGYSTGFVPDNRHVVETMAESEGFGSSGRVDTEMTLSEDSCQPQRKCISLNMDSYDGFGVPMQVLSLSKMSKSERKDLELRLKRELEQVRIFQKKVVSLTENSVILSPASDIRSCNDGQKRPIDNVERAPGQSGSVKKRVPPGHNSSHVKKGMPGHAEPVRPPGPASASNALLIKRCENLLNQLMSHQYGWVFNTPVDVVKLNIPDYFTVIKHPMDLGSVKSKMASGEYSSPLGFAADVRLTFSNAMTYNPPGNDVHVMASVLSKFFEARWRAIEKKIPSSTDVQSGPSRIDMRMENEIMDKVPPPKKKKVMPATCNVKQEPMKRVMTKEERGKLSMELENLLAELPESIIDFLKENSSTAGQISEDEIEIDIDALSDDTLFKLRKLLDDYLLEKNKSQTKAEPCEMELHNESGFSNSSIQPCKGNDAVDEDVDIGGHDPMISRFPPVNLETDVPHKNSNSSSSSSESGSSGTDSDLGSSSDSEPDGAKTLHPAKGSKGPIKAEADFPQKNDFSVQDIIRNQSHGLSQAEENCHNKPPQIEVDGYKDEDCGPSERHVSPEKLYRAALLRSRFADTILKAQEKTFEKGEKRDPEKLRLEREELERRQREEKARLQAEAKAAEEARKKAEAEAAAEAKRKRELEREAARLALQKMQKTVDINENCQFMEDLEMLSAAPPENLSTFLGSSSLNDCDNGLGSFKLQGSNPLEQLGLYMKMDDEDEDEAEPLKGAPDPLNDVEEGEID